MGTPGLFAASGQDPSGPMTANITLINLTGLPRIALGSSFVPTPTLVANRRPAPAAVLDATASIGPGETVSAKTVIAKNKTKPHISTNAPGNRNKTASAADSRIR
jgi:hypothetical protein